MPKVSIEEVPAPKEATVIVAEGSNLGAVGAEAYGHERFSGFIAAMNGIADPERVQAGASLKTPSLAVAFRDAGADATFQPALNVLSKACTDYYAIEPAYLAARQASGVERGEFAIPSEIAAKLRACADAIDAAVATLSTARVPHTRPSMTIDQFGQAAWHIRDLAAGHIDGYGYDYDLVGQRFGLAFTNALIWTQNHHR
ncbi:hypothetical protein BGE01nite_50990 [Brevifollis gellanilyticus]|uniref:Uncharacterized protein n=1 Tax=Brevifollis gellanilyticus TaxID=748831 RepID=A0A512MGF8_9BACT|nr:hypothetical protein BGE01nite_50990 [Brevifollis gellanilyticus]